MRHARPTTLYALVHCFQFGAIRVSSVSGGVYFAAPGAGGRGVGVDVDASVHLDTRGHDRMQDSGSLPLSTRTTDFADAQTLAGHVHVLGWRFVRRRIQGLAEAWKRKDGLPVQSIVRRRVAEWAAAWKGCPTLIA